MYTTISDALSAADEGATIEIQDGVYMESLEISVAGVTLVAAGEVVVRAPGTVLRVRQPRITIDGLVLDGEYGSRDAVIVEANDFLLRNSEVQRSSRDCVDIRGTVTGVRIESSRIHHCLRSSRAACDQNGCREDAHGVVADMAGDLTIVDTEIHTFSGDAVQMNGRDQSAMWGTLTIDRCRFWLAPLPEAEGGFAAGIVPGENAIDTKTPDDIVEPAQLTVSRTRAWGYRGGLISNMAAYNIKENVQARFDAVDVFDSEIAFRLRGATSQRPRGADVTVINAVIWNVDTALRYEDDILPIAVQHMTLGADISRPFQRAGAPTDTLQADNVLWLGETVPAELGAGTNLGVDASSFVNVADNDYRLLEMSPAVNSGAASEVATDRDGVMRPQGDGPDIGAFEWCADCTPASDGGVPFDSGVDGDAALPDAAAGTDSAASVADAAGGSGDAGANLDASRSGADNGGCSCRVGSPGHVPATGGLVGLALLGLRRRARR